MDAKREQRKPLLVNYLDLGNSPSRPDIFGPSLTSSSFFLAAAIIAARAKPTMGAATFSDVSVVNGPKNLRRHFGQNADVN